MEPTAPVEITPTSPVAPLAGATPVAGAGAASDAAAVSDAAPAVAEQSAATPSATPTALQAAVAQAAGRQGGLAPLLADLSAALAGGALPAAVRGAANQLLALQVPFGDGLTGEDVRQALAQSGLFLEAQLASAGVTASPDLKAALLTLTQALQAWLGPGATARAAAAALSPPYRGGPLQAQPPAEAAPAADLAALGQRLLSEANAASARQVLLQAASMPDGGAQHQSQTQSPLLRFEIPFATPQGLAVAPFEIGRDGSGGGSGGSGEEAAWSARFSLSLEAIGPVHAQIVLKTGQVRVTLWAENAETAAALSAAQSELSAALGGEDQAVVVVKVLHGAPQTPAPPSGRLVDQAL